MVDATVSPIHRFLDKKHAGILELYDDTLVADAGGAT